MELRKVGLIRELGRWTDPEPGEVGLILEVGHNGTSWEEGSLAKNGTLFLTYFQNYCSVVLRENISKVLCQIQYIYFKGTVAPDFRPAVFFTNQTHLFPWFIP